MGDRREHDLDELARRLLHHIQQIQTRGQRLREQLLRLRAIERSRPLLDAETARLREMEAELAELDAQLRDLEEQLARLRSSD
jgi:cell division protein FtsB